MVVNQEQQKENDGMKRRSMSILVLTMLSVSMLGEGEAVTGIHKFTMKSITGEDVKLAGYRGKVLLIVNVASKCGFTGQYEGLQKLYEKYKDRGFLVLGFPANDFLGQEPGTDGEIKQFCTLSYGVSFPMFSKISVKGKEQHPLYKYLTDKKTNPEHGGKITWNFNKFLMDADGQVINRFGSRVQPMDDDLVKAIEQALGGSTPQAAAAE